tara:strand:+ start:832 stop:1908 length:1077 start_codon:yes stop_codon:yes gene_type:complete
MKELFEKYKYHIGGSTIGLIILYMIYGALIKKNDNSDKEPLIKFKEDKKEVVKAEISHEEFILFMKTLKEQLQNLTQSMMKFNANHIKTHSKYKDFRDKLFTKDIIKKSILIDSVSVKPDDTSNYVVNFGSDIYGEVFKNVIGFRLVKATVPHTAYTIDDNNTNIVFNNGSDVNVSLSPGSYTFKQLGNHLQTRINSTSLSGFSVTSNLNNFKYTISHSSGFIIKWADSNTGPDIYKIFGFNNSNTSSSTSHTSDNAADQTKHFVDLVIPEIPSIACKMGSKKQVVDRIPLNSPSGSLVYYRSPEGELQTHNYFYPMKLSRLTIQLYDNDSTNFYDCNNGHNYFEFEITIVENTELFK